MNHTFSSLPRLSRRANPVIVLDNVTGVGDDGWCLIAPFGEWPKTRVFREAGRVREQNFIQVLDEAAADAMLSRENSLFGRLKRAFVGVPVFKGHGDLPDVDPQALAPAGGKIKLGVVDQIRKSPRGLEAHFALDPDGAAAVAAGWRFPSGFWYVQPTGTRGEAILARPFKLISVALTPFPNISGVESLANAALPFSPTTTKTFNHEPDMKLIIGWLLAQGIALANTENPSEAQVLDALQRLHASAAADVTALGNEKQTLGGKITALTAELDQSRRRVDDAVAALGNEKTARAAERQARAEAVVDLAIQRGQATVAQRDDHVATLVNSADLASATQALLSGPTIVKTVGQEAQSGKQNAGLPNELQLQAEYSQAFQTELIATGQNPARAHNNIMTLPKYAGLAQKLLPRPA